MPLCVLPDCRRELKLLKCDVPPWDAAADSLAARFRRVQSRTMGRASIILAIATAALISASPAWASGGMAIPEPTDLTLLALGLAGLIIGRRGAKRPPRQD